MKLVIRRIVLSVAALSPSVAFVAVQEFALSFSLLLIGFTGAISVAVGITAVTPKLVETVSGYESPDTPYPSLLTKAALQALRQQLLDITIIRVQMTRLLAPGHGANGFATKDDQVAMVLAQIMAKWRVMDLAMLGDDQIRELWFIEQLLRASPEKAGSLADSFRMPTAMLAMRDRIANATPALVG